MEATLCTIDDALTPAANWVLALQDIEESLENRKQFCNGRHQVQDKVGIPFISTLKANISRFTRCSICIQYI